MAEDVINHPFHYESCAKGGYQPIDLIELYPLNLGMAQKYLFRCGKKDDNPIEQELKKSRWYLRRQIVDLKPDAIILPQAKAVYGHLEAAEVLERAKMLAEILVLNNENANPLLVELFLGGSHDLGVFDVPQIERVIGLISNAVGE